MISRRGLFTRDPMINVFITHACCISRAPFISEHYKVNKRISFAKTKGIRQGSLGTQTSLCRYYSRKIGVKSQQLQHLRLIFFWWIVFLNIFFERVRTLHHTLLLQRRVWITCNIPITGKFLPWNSKETVFSFAYFFNGTLWRSTWYENAYS